MSGDLLQRFLAVREASEAHCEPLLPEDYGLQAIPETSPPKWHLAHTSWFFETFILKHYQPGFAPYEPLFEVLFNSYYNGIGAQHPRPQRGLLSRPPIEEVLSYRQHVTDAVVDLMQSARAERAEIESLVELGIHHEQQHQELFFTDIKYNLSCNPIRPAYLEGDLEDAPDIPLEWIDHEGGEFEAGYHDDSFCFDNELPRHRVLLQPFALSNRLVSNAEYLAFMEAGGYQAPEFWLADGWARVQEANWSQPLYWFRDGDEWWEYTLYGPKLLDPNRPACHISGYEADAYARWAGARLPSEFEWEAAAVKDDSPGQFLDSGALQPLGRIAGDALQNRGYAWQWTSSAYAPYPGFAPAGGAVGEYNGKFMANQLVLRGGSCVTPRNHMRDTYRNFFYPPDRWQFTGIRLAQWR